MADKSVIGGGLGSITDAEIKDLTSQDIEGRGIDYYRKLGELISPDYAKPTVPEVMFNFFSGMAESASKPGATFAGSVGQGGRTAGEYLFKQEMLRKKRERELPLTGLRLKSLTGKGKDTKSMVVVGDFEKDGELVPLGSTYNPTDREITDNPSAFATASNSDEALLNYAINFPADRVLTPSEASAFDVAFTKLGQERVNTVTDADGTQRTIVQSKVPLDTIKALTGALLQRLEENRRNLRESEDSSSPITPVRIRRNPKTRKWEVVSE
tara:strand:+ start:186 stop:992 length:807 start_codon:yes stop_codon:yes gene_type:complete